jgi:hypothetical protein
MLPIKLNISAVDSEAILGDASVVVKDEHRRLVFVQKPHAAQVPISYVGMPDTGIQNINIIDNNESPTGISLLANSYRMRFQKRQTDKRFNLPLKQALITDVFNVDINGNPIPLFYKHVIDDGFSSPPQILDQDMNPVSGMLYKVEVGLTVVAVYHNLAPRIDVENRGVRAYYITYKKSTGEQIFTLLQTDPVYSKATVLDGLDPWRRTYSVRRLNAAYQYRILYNGNGPWYIRHDEDYQIKLRKPEAALATDPWHLRITDGELLGDDSGSLEKYSIPEYHFQTFAGAEPNVLVPTTECILLDQHRVKIPFANLLVNDDFPLDILVTDESFKPRFGWTGSGKIALLSGDRREVSL